MRYLLFTLFVTNLASAQTLDQFLSKNDEQKMEFLYEKAVAIDDALSLKKYEKSNPDKIKFMLEIGKDIINLWYDTILEGPYQLTGTAKTELTTIYNFQGTTYALGGLVTSPAYFTDDSGCTYNEVDETYVDCYETTIYQNFYMDIKGNFIESEDYPQTDD